METLTIKLDAAEVLEAIGKMLEPGSVLLSAEAVHKLVEILGFPDMDTLVEVMRSAGGIEGP